MPLLISPFSRTSMISTPKTITYDTQLLTRTKNAVIGLLAISVYPWQYAA